MKRRSRVLAGFRKERERAKSPVAITLSTKVPSKWRLVDLETGEAWASVEVGYSYTRGRVGSVRKDRSFKLAARFDPEQLHRAFGLKP